MINVKENGHPEHDITLAAIYIQGNWDLAEYTTQYGWDILNVFHHDWKSSHGRDIEFYIELPENPNEGVLR